MKPYPKYKDSGVEWIGEIPEGWKTNKFSRTAFYQEGPGLRNWQFKESGTRVICVTNITEEGIDFSNYTRFIDVGEYEKKYTHFTVNKGDILLSSSGASWGKIAEYMSEEKVMLNTSTIRINSNKNKTMNRSFIKWLMKSEITREQLRVLMTGSCQPNFGPSHLNQLYISYPIEKSDQKQIAKYLDHKTVKIGSLIEKKKRLIELLKEERTAVINQAVIKGLDPVPMEDSGIEWLGEIPAHWGVKKLKHLAKINNSNVDKKTNDGEFPVRLCNYTDVYYNDYIHPDLELMAATATEEEINKFRLKRGDVIITKDSESWDDIAVPAYVKESSDEIVCGYHLAHIRPVETKLRGKYLFYAFMSDDLCDQFEISATGVTRYGLPKFAIDNSQFAIPHVSEQEQITKHLDEETTRIDSIISKSEKEIELLLEFRTALISEVVTGKIDVREEKI